MRIVIIVLIGIVSFLAIFVPGYLFIVPRGPETPSEVKMGVPGADMGDDFMEAPGADPGMAPPLAPPALGPPPAKKT